jgi:hypothetical protein
MNPSLWQRRRLLIFLGVAAVLVAAGVLLAVLPAAQSSSPGSPPAPAARAQPTDTSTKMPLPSPH